MEDISRYGPLAHTIGNYGIRKRGSLTPPTPPEVRTYATWNPANKGAEIYLLEGNLRADNYSSNANTVLSTINKSTGKWYWEYTINSVVVNNWAGVSSPTFNVAGFAALGQQQYSVAYLTSGEKSFFSGAWTINAYGSSHTAGDILGVAVDCDAGTTTFFKNGVSQGVAYTIPANTKITAAMTLQIGSVTANFGATPFAYPVPSGYNAGLYDTVDLSAGLVANYPLATNSLDTSGNGYNGTDTDITYSSGSAILNGSTSFITNSTALWTPGAFTMSCWFKPTSNASLWGYKYIMYATDGGTTGFTIIYVNTDGVPKLFGGKESSGLAFSNARATITLNSSNWYNLCVTSNGTTDTVYIDGVNLASAATLGNGISNRTVGTYLGKRSDGNFSDGAIKKARLYNRVLNAGEIAALYAEG